MSVSSLGASQGSGASQYLAELLSRLKSTNTQATNAYSETGSTRSAQAGKTADAATGATAPTLSDQVIGALVMLQMQSAQPQTNTSPSSMDPVNSAFEGIDSDADGSISQSELETAIQAAGGTSEDAATIFGALGGSDSTGISKDAFQEAAQAGGPPAGGPRRRPDDAPAMDGQNPLSASGLLSALDTNQDGTVSSDELASVSEDAAAPARLVSDLSSNFAGVDSNGDGAISEDELNTFLEDLKSQAASNRSTFEGFRSADSSYKSVMGLLSQSQSTQGVTA
jgi:Ca2+-binding EF-hand superfamily protein